MRSILESLMRAVIIVTVLACAATPYVVTGIFVLAVLYWVFTKGL